MKKNIFISFFVLLSILVFIPKGASATLPPMPCYGAILNTVDKGQIIASLAEFGIQWENVSIKNMSGDCNSNIYPYNFVFNLPANYSSLNLSYEFITSINLSDKSIIKDEIPRLQALDENLKSIIKELEKNPRIKEINQVYKLNYAQIADDSPGNKIRIYYSNPDNNDILIRFVYENDLSAYELTEYSVSSDINHQFVSLPELNLLQSYLVTEYPECIAAKPQGVRIYMLPKKDESGDYYLANISSISANCFLPYFIIRNNQVIKQELYSQINTDLDSEIATNKKTLAIESDSNIVNFNNLLYFLIVILGLISLFLILNFLLKKGKIKTLIFLIIILLFLNSLLLMFYLKVFPVKIETITLCTTDDWTLTDKIPCSDHLIYNVPNSLICTIIGGNWQGHGWYPGYSCFLKKD